MGARSGGGSRGGGGAGASQAEQERWSDVNTVQRALQYYANVDRWNKSSEYQLGFNDEAQGLVEDLAKGNYGLASTIAKQAVERPNWKKYGSKFSDKQAYVMAKAAVDAKIVPHHTIFDGNITKQVKAQAAQQAAAKAQKYAAYSASYTKSSTKVAVGSRVHDAKHGWGTISGVITKSSGYVTVKYDSGSSSKAMAFNLTGEDGNPLKKRPK